MSQKIFYNGKEIRDASGHFSSFKVKAKRFLKRVLMLGFVAGVVYLGFLVGEAKPPLIKEVIAESNIPPVLQRISNCETTGNVKTKGTHLDKNGQVLINATRDMGLYQINVPTWGKKATEMGLNLTLEKDNEKMAVWIYENKGTGPWSSSSKCWQ